MPIYTTTAAILLLSSACPLSALAVGEAVPWVTAEAVLQHGPAIPEPFHLERYRGGVVLLVCWNETGASGRIKFKVHQELAELRLEHRDQGVLVLGVAVDRAKVESGLGDTGLRGPVLIVSQETLDALGPVEEFKRLRMVIGPDGRIVAEGMPPDLHNGLEAALAARTPYGRWITLAPVYFHLFSTVAKVEDLQQQINVGKVGAALVKARRYAEDTKDQALANEGRFVVETCETWITQALAIEAAAREAGDLYTAGLVSTGMSEVLSGAEEGNAAKERLKAITSDPAYKVGKTFYDTWTKTWTMSPDKHAATLNAFADKYPDSYGATQIKAWLAPSK